MASRWPTVYPTDRTTASFYCTDLHMGHTWCQHAQLHVDIPIRPDRKLQNKMATRKRQTFGRNGAHRVILIRLKRTCWPWINLPKTWNSQWNSIILYWFIIQGGLGDIPLGFFFHQCRDWALQKTQFLGQIIYIRVICGKTGAKYRSPLHVEAFRFQKNISIIHFMPRLMSWHSNAREITCWLLFRFHQAFVTSFLQLGCPIHNIWITFSLAWASCCSKCSCTMLDR